MAKPVKARAVQALIDALGQSLPASRGALVDSTGRAERFEDNLVSSLSSEQISLVRAQLAGGDGHELDFGENGERPDAHAAHSSAALACNAFAIWMGRESQLAIDGISGFQSLRVEVKQRIFRGGRHPNLDALAVASTVAVGVESKLTEHLARHAARPWSEAYGRESTRALLSDGWLTALDDARASDYRPEYLDVDQLVKHALGLSKQHSTRGRHLLYVFWEPSNGDELPEVVQHRAEVAALRERVGDASPRLHAMTYAELWNAWDALGLPWLSQHVALLRQRYAIAVSS